MYLQKVLSKKRGKSFWYLEVHWRKEQDQDQDPDPNPLVRRSVPKRTKMSQILKTGVNWAKVVVAYCKRCQFHNLCLVISFFKCNDEIFRDFPRFFWLFLKMMRVSSACRKSDSFFHFNFFFEMCRSEVAKAASQTDEVESKLHGKFAFTSQNYLPNIHF